MNETAVSTPLAAVLALTLGVALLVFATFLSVRRGAGASSFGWAVIGGSALAIVGMGAALRAPGSGGLTAALAQLLSVVLAAVLGVLCAPDAEGGQSGAGRLAPAGRMLAWLSLIGLPPTPGFHAKVLLYRALLGAGWPGVTVLALLASWLLLLPALRDARTLQPGPTVRARMLAVALLVMALVALSFYPYIWLPGGAAGPSTAPNSPS